ncbi:hypothetical protein HN958_04680 [Candidatus Falkowbacteria bacterium]|jgi:Fe2+ or Zn2+ uptake regulation protein|nr:hypothetical protein [Candidatus Falkowbacteria bacterium]MBT7007767.1 hypothetical protein [Candidatus Falkowbacteria bacterium]
MKEDLKNIILRSFKYPETHPTAEELYETVKAQVEVEPKHFLHTLQELKKEKQIYAISSADKKYHYGKEKGPHFHFICDECGIVRDFVINEGAMDVVTTYIQKNIKSFGILKRTNLSVAGKCQQCQGKS